MYRDQREMGAHVRHRVARGFLVLSEVVTPPPILSVPKRESPNIYIPSYRRPLFYEAASARCQQE